MDGDRIVTDDKHTVCLSIEKDDHVLVQFFESFEVVKWTKWACRIVSQTARDKWETEHADHRLSGGLYRVPVCVRT